MKKIISLCLLLPLFSGLAFAANEKKPETPPANPPAGEPAKPGEPGKPGKPKHGPEQAFKKLDANNDSSLSLEEFKAGPIGKKDPAKAEQVFKRKDKDADGKMTLEEFKASGPKPPKGPKGPKGPKEDAPAK
jgi:hypothetical protein